MTAITITRHANQSAADNKLLALLETKIKTLISTDSKEILHEKQSAATQAGMFHFSKGGKRTRGKLAIHAGLALGLSEHDALCLAAVTELLHNASLIHDDLQDGDCLRHERPTVWVQFGAPVAICAGDLLLSAAYGALCGVSNASVVPALLALVHERTSQAVHGQCADLDALKSRMVQISEYEKIVRAKSGALLSLPLELALVACGKSRWTDQARHAAEALSLAYQVVDDLTDLHADAQKGSLNIVSILEASAGAKHAESCACLFGLQHLDAADMAAADLPCHSGSFLLLMSKELRNVLLTRSGN